MKKQSGKVFDIFIPEGVLWQKVISEELKESADLLLM